MAEGGWDSPITPGSTQSVGYGITRTDGNKFSHPVYNQLSMTNGRINKMTKEEIKGKLESLKLDIRGNKDVLKKRLKSYYKRKKLHQAHLKPQDVPRYDFFLVIDFEATCEEYNPDGFKHEIIEFPAILVNSKTREVVSEFHSYVQPVLNPRLTPFCTKLTGITQLQVQKSPTFPEVLAQMEVWMESHQLGNGKTFTVVTDGPWDMSRFMFLQCQISKLQFPKWASKWVNLRKAFCNFYKIQRAKLVTMLENLGMAFEGQQHSGLDDARNIARIVTHMLTDGCDLKANEKLFSAKKDIVDRVFAEVRPVLRRNNDSTDSDPDEEITQENGVLSNCDCPSRNVNDDKENRLKEDSGILSGSVCQCGNHGNNGAANSTGGINCHMLEQLEQDLGDMHVGWTYSRKLTPGKRSPQLQQGRAVPARCQHHSSEKGTAVSSKHPHSAVLDCPESPADEGIEDLLSYYALQKT